MKRALFCSLSALALFASIPALALPPVPPAQVVAGVDNSTNLAHPVRTDAAGNVYIIGSGSTGAVYGPTPIGSAPSQAPIFNAGIDGGGLTRGILTDTSGRQLVVGAGVAGAPAGGVVSMQGVSGGTNLPVSQATASALNATVVQATASALNATVVQATASSLNATVVQSTASSLNATVVQATAANLNATVVNAAGSAIMGKVGIDQTTPGTTNGVQSLSGSTTAATQATAANLNAQVQGAGANNSAVVGNPVLVAGYDGTTTRTFLADSSGNAYNRPARAATYSVQNFNGSTTTGTGTVLFQLKGSASKTIRITSVEVWGTGATSTQTLLFFKRDSAALSGGTCASVTPAAYNTSSAAATATAQVCSVPATEGTNVSTIKNIAPLFAVAGTQIIRDVTKYSDDIRASEVVLNGTGDYFSITASTPISGGVGITVEFTEE